MVIEAINGLNINNRVNFGSRRSNEDRPDSTSKDYTAVSSSLKTVPVVVLMAMNPSLLNANLPNMEPEANIIEAVAPEAAENLEKTYVMSPLPPNDVNELAPLINSKTIQHTEKVMINGRKYTLLYNDSFKMHRNIKNLVNEIYLVPDNYKVVRDWQGEIVTEPPEVKKFIYHDLGDDKEFCSVKLLEFLPPEGAQSQKARHSEIRLPDEVANKIFWLISGKTEFKPSSNIKELFGRVNTPYMEPEFIN